jgi:hypothetical protein
MLEYLYSLCYQKYKNLNQRSNLFSEFLGGSKMAALAGGIAALVLGIIGIIIWWGEFIGILLGGVPVILILGGALAAYLGFEEIKDKKTTESFDDTTQDKIQREVKDLKKEIKDLKEDKEEPEKEEGNTTTQK